MASRNAELEVKTSTEAAANFADFYYTAINKQASLAPFYVSASARYRDAGLRADVVINGRVLPDVVIPGRVLPDGDAATAADPSRPEQQPPAASTSAAALYESLLRRQRATASGEAARVTYHVESVDAHVLNADYIVGCPEHVLRAPAGTEQPRFSLLVQVGGWVAYGGDKDAPRRSFSEVFVLVPNWESFGRNAPRNAKRYLILSQNFRAL